MLKRFHEILSSVLDDSNCEISCLSDSIGASYNTVLSWTNGDSYPCLRNFAALCKELDVSADYLLGFSNQRSFRNDVFFKPPYEISERLKRLTPESLELVYQIIRHIAISDDSLLLFDSFYMDSIYPDANTEKSMRISRAHVSNLLYDLDPDLRAKAEGYLEALMDTQRERNRKEENKA